jgi:hypothetical protein
MKKKTTKIGRKMSQNDPKTSAITTLVGHLGSCLQNRPVAARASGASPADSLEKLNWRDFARALNEFGMPKPGFGFVIHEWVMAHGERPPWSPAPQTPVELASGQVRAPIFWVPNFDMSFGRFSAPLKLIENINCLEPLENHWSVNLGSDDPTNLHRPQDPPRPIWDGTTQIFRRHGTAEIAWFFPRLEFEQILLAGTW